MKRTGARGPGPAAVCAVVLSVSLSGASAQDWRATALAAFDEVWQTVHTTFYDPTFGGLDWEAVRAELRPAAQAAKSPEAVREIIRAMLARLNASHFALLATTEGPNTVAGSATVPVDVRVLAQGVVVSHVTPGSSAERAGLRPGDIIRRIDRQEVSLPASEDGGAGERAGRVDLWLRALGALHGQAGSFARIAIERPPGPVSEIRVERSPPAGETVTLGNLPPLQARAATSEVRTPGGRRVGVISFSVWMAAVAEPIAAAVDAYRDADGLVLDLRGNPGGLMEMIRGVAGHLLGEPALLGRVQTRDLTLEFAANPRRSTPDGRRVEPFDGPVALLVDEQTASASECFAGGLQSLGRARVFGVPTMGRALPASTRQLANGDVLLYAVGDFVTSTGQRLEGQGVVPDEIVVESIASLAARHDLVLERALIWIDGRQPSAAAGSRTTRIVLRGGSTRVPRALKQISCSRRGFVGIL